jgi:HNH endonuclease
MTTYVANRSENALLQDAAMHAAHERESQSRLLVDIAEIDARKVYREAGHDSIHSYCMQELRLSEKAAFHRIWVARVAWKFPCVLLALADARLHMSAVRLLATHLTEENAEELTQAAANKTTPEIVEFLSQRFPVPQEPALALETSATTSIVHSDPSPGQETSDQHPLGGVQDYIAPVPVAPSADRFPLNVGLKRETHEKIRRAHDLLAHVLPSGGVDEVLSRALDLLIRTLEKRKFANTDRPRRRNQSPSARRAIPAEVRRAVWKRDRGQCTFIAESGRCCGSRRRLEFDHIRPLARGGESTVSNVRLLCRAHNQLLAEQTLGRDLVQNRMERAREAAARKSAEQAKNVNAQLVSGLRRLGFGAEESKRAVADFDGPPRASAETRMRAALAYLIPERPRTPFSEPTRVST